MTARCGTDSGYHRHRVQQVPFPEDAGGQPCGCRAAHAASELRRRRAAGSPPRPKKPTRACVDCGTAVHSTRCRSCATKASAARARADRAAREREEIERPIRWVLVRGVWRAAA